MRINKYLASAGLGSRRKVEELVTSGQIKVNNVVVTDLATDVSSTDTVKFGARIIKPANKFVYYKLNKPKGYITTSADDKERKTVLELMRGVHERVFPVGRLDYDSEGLLLLTNDGDVTNILTKPNSEIEKTYLVHATGEISNENLKKLSKGVDIGGYVTKPCRVMVVAVENKPNAKTVTKNMVTKLEITITEGKNRQIRKMLEAIGSQVTYLRRVRIGEITLGGLSRGEYRPLNPKELKFINSLKR